MQFCVFSKMSVTSQGDREISIDQSGYTCMFTHTKHCAYLVTIPK